MPLRVYTAQLPNPRARIRGYSGPDSFNVTRRGGGSAGSPFAPSDALLDEANKRKRKAYGNEEALRSMWFWYLPRFIEEMRRSYRDNHAAWRALASRAGEVTLCCYCATADRCHRRVLAEMLVAVGKKLGIEIIDCGERPPSV